MRLLAQHSLTSDFRLRPRGSSTSMSMLGRHRTCFRTQQICRDQQKERKITTYAGKGFGATKSPKKKQAPAEKTVDEAEYAKRQKRFQQDFKNSALAWDDTFASICKDAATAQHLWQMADKGYQQRGRGCVFVRVEVHDRFKVGKKTTNMKAGLSGAPLPTNPDLLITSMEMNYIPLSFLRSPGPSSATSIPGAGVLPSVDNLQVTDGPAAERNGSSVRSTVSPTGAVSSSGAEDDSIIDVNIDEGYVAPDVLEQLQRAMRGMDPSRTINLVAGENLDIGGERGYNPSNGEAVVLLATRVDGMPLIGADIVAKQAQPDGSIKLIFPEAMVE